MSYRKITVDGSIALSWSLPYTSGLIVATYNDLDATAISPSIGVSLPPANNVELGTSIVFNNIGTIECPILAWGGVPLNGEDYSLPAGEVITVYNIEGNDAVGKWQIISGSGEIGIVSITAKNIDNSVVITDVNSTTNPTITPPGGVLTFSCAPSIANLLNLSVDNQTGIVVAIGTNPSDYGTREILAGSTNINVTNGDGVSGDPQIDLNTILTNINNIGIGTTTLTSGSISDTTALNLSSPAISLNGVAIDNAQNITNVNSITSNTITATNLTVSGSFNNPSSASAWCNFADPATGSYPVTVPITNNNGFNVTSVICVNPGVYQVNFTNALTNVSYATVATLTMGAGSIAPYQVFVQVQQLGYVSIFTVDTLGNLLPALYGISVVVFGS